MNYSLRDIQEEDLQLVLTWRNSDRIRANMYTDEIIAMDEHRSWFKKLEGNPKVQCKMFIFQDTPVGVVNFTDIDVPNGKCHWGFYLGETNVPKGSGTIMGYLAMEYGFETLDMHKICGETFTFNSASINFHKRLGFIQEGHFIKHVLKNGVYEDIYIFAQLKEQWQENKKALDNILTGGNN